MPGEAGDDLEDDLSLEDFDDETLDEGTDPDTDLGDDADQGGDGRGSEHSSQSASDEGLDEGQSQVRQPSRAQARIEKLDRERREAEDRARDLENRLRSLETSTNRASDEAREQERIAQMDPLERAEYLAQRAENRTATMINGLRQEMADQNDRATFAAECASNPRLAKVKDEVEKRLSEARGGGVTLPRRTLAAYLIGEKILTEAPKARATAERRAAGNLSRERARPTGGGSDAPANRTRDEKSARMARLQDASI